MTEILQETNIIDENMVEAENKEAESQLSAAEEVRSWLTNTENTIVLAEGEEVDSTPGAELIKQNRQGKNLTLKMIKIAGFKSFVDSTTLILQSHLVGIVGPNGCGKSNIIDAVLWVMGESSAKYLRGESIIDVIFNGSTARQPVGQAMVELTFDNPHGALGGEYAKYSEIAVRRQVTRDGKSQYFLNNVACRRRDIIDIFLGTGLGPRSYAIITQGTISRVIEAKPDEMRIYLEEAAGISKYKERRRETENRMRHTRDNLDRLNDLREELDKQLQRLQRQAREAERYQELMKEKRVYESQVQALYWQQLAEELSTKQQEIRHYELAVEEQITKLGELNTAIERARETFHDNTEHFNQVQKRYYDIGAQVAQKEQMLTHQKERVQQYQQDLHQVNESINENEQQMVGDQQSYAELQQEITGLIELAPLEEQCKQAEKTLIESEQRVQDWQMDWETFNAAAAKSSQVAQVQQTQIQHHENSMQSALKRIERLQQEKTEIAPDRFSNEIEQYQQQLENLQEKQRQGQLTLQEYNQRKQDCRQQQQKINQEIDQTQRQLQNIRTEYASLTGLQQAALGQHNKHVMQWLERYNLSENTRLAELLNVDEGWERAVETVLSPYLQAVCMDDCKELASMLLDMPQGNVSFLSKHTIDNLAQTFPLPSLSEKISNSDIITGLLLNIFYTEDLATAFNYQSQLQVNQSIITRTGVWIGPNWLRVAAPTDDKSGVIERERELKKLQLQLDEWQVKLETLQQTKQHLQQQLQDTEQQQDEMQKTYNQSASEISEVQLQLKIRQNRTEQLQQRLRQIEQELQDIDSQRQKNQHSLHQAREVWQQAMQELEQQSSQREQLQTEKLSYYEALNQAKQHHQSTQQQWHELTLKRQTIESALQAKQHSIKRLEQQLQQSLSQRERLETNLQQAQDPIEGLQQSLQELLEQRLDIQETLDEANRQVQHIEHELRESEREKHTVEQRLEDSRQKLEKFKLQQESLTVRQSGIVEQLAKMEMELTSVIAELPEGASSELWNEELEKINTRIQRLGAINLAAIEEYQTQLERKTYLDKQNDDLQEALSILENAIHKINRETRHLFKQTFDAVNDGFQKLFPKVFNGGTASLILNDEDLLNAGVVVMAQPPGKRNSSIHLLSGGEKALTAIALVFAIFQLNPAPFCMLDEVDAPLDDANVLRYSNLVKEMSKDIQFIFISHNKGAIEMADHLVGVTMHEAGVSRIVSVDVEQAIALSEH